MDGNNARLVCRHRRQAVTAAGLDLWFSGAPCERHISRRGGPFFSASVSTGLALALRAASAASASSLALRIASALASCSAWIRAARRAGLFGLPVGATRRGGCAFGGDRRIDRRLGLQFVERPLLGGSGIGGALAETRGLVRRHACSFSPAGSRAAGSGWPNIAGFSTRGDVARIADYPGAAPAQHDGIVERRTDHLRCGGDQTRTSLVAIQPVRVHDIT